MKRCFFHDGTAVVKNRFSGMPLWGVGTATRELGGCWYCRQRLNVGADSAEAAQQRF